MASIREILIGLEKRLENNRHALIFFKDFLKGNLVSEINQAIKSNNRISMVTDFDNKQPWTIIYNVAASILFDSALKHYDQDHLDIFHYANNVSLAFCEEVESQLRIDMEFIQIESPIDQLIKEGVIETDNRTFIFFVGKKGEIGNKEN